MEIITGKYTSLGNGIQVRRNSNDTYTYYFNLRDNDNKVKRVKLFARDKYNTKDFKTAIIQSAHIQKGSLKNTEKITLNDLAKHYFKSRYTKKTNILRQAYNNMSDKEFAESKTVSRRLSSVRTEEQKYNKNIQGSDLAKLNVLNINRELIKVYTDTYLPTKKLGEKSTHHIISLIKTIFNYAKRNEHIDMENPFDNIIFKNPKRKRTRYLNEDELALLLNTCKEYESNPNVYLIVYLAVMTAARAQMILNIKKKDINLQNGQIKLSNFKSNKHYVIKLNKESLDWLDKKILTNIGYNDYLVQPTNKRDIQTPQQPLSEIPKTIYKIMDELFNQHLDKSNNNDRDFVVNIHTIRRSIATNLALQGSSIYNIMVLLNHSSIKQTQDYLNLENDTLSEDTNKLFSTIFNETMNKITK
jgi:integrase